MDSIALIGYSGHSYVVADIFLSAMKKPIAYCDLLEKETNPYGLAYLGFENESSVQEKLKAFQYFVAIGDNALRQKVQRMLQQAVHDPEIAIHASAVVSKMAEVGIGTMVGPLSVINSKAIIGSGVICNSGSVIEHECQIGDFAHIGPGAVLGGNVSVGEGTFVGANSVVRPGISIGNNVMIGAGTVVVKNIPDNSRVVGNPQRAL